MATSTEQINIITNFFNGIVTDPNTFAKLATVSIFIIIFFLISLILKGFALWISTKNGQMWWFISLFTINTMGILEVIYLIFFRNKKATETKVTLAQSENKSNGKKF